MALESVVKAAQRKNLTVDFLELRPFSSEIFPNEKWPSQLTLASPRTVQVEVGITGNTEPADDVSGKNFFGYATPFSCCQSGGKRKWHRFQGRKEPDLVSGAEYILLKQVQCFPSLIMFTFDLS